MEKSAKERKILLVFFVCCVEGECFFRPLLSVYLFYTKKGFRYNFFVIYFYCLALIFSLVFLFVSSFHHAFMLPAKYMCL